MCSFDTARIDKPVGLRPSAAATAAVIAHGDVGGGRNGEVSTGYRTAGSSCNKQTPTTIHIFFFFLGNTSENLTPIHLKD